MPLLRGGCWRPRGVGWTVRGASRTADGRRGLLNATDAAQPPVNATNAAPATDAAPATNSSAFPPSPWRYAGFFFRLAVDLVDRVLPAFDTHTSIPFGAVNLLTGVQAGETTEASIAGGGGSSLNFDFELLGRLTGRDCHLHALYFRR